MARAARSEQIRPPEPPRLDEAARAVLSATAAAPGEDTLARVAERVASAVAEAEPPESRGECTERFFALIGESRFLPAIPVLSNAGRGGQLAPCFVLEPGDSLDSIYATLHRASRIQQGSGGVGIHLSRLRPRGAPIATAGGVSPGPVAFAELFAHSARINALAGRRAGAHLAVLRDDHPDVLDFVRAGARDPDAFRALGFALSVSDGLIEEAARGESHRLSHPHGGAATHVPARELLDTLARSIAAVGEPTVLFRDTIEGHNPVPELGAIEATNPCGEQPLLPGESCVLGSLCLPALTDASGELDPPRLAETVRDAIRFLDDVVEVNAFPDEQIAAATRRTRKLGLGVMGFADWLLLRGVPYDDTAALDLASRVTREIGRVAREASEALAEERGAYPAWKGADAPRRNATLLAIAPTGTLRLISRCSGGMEPLLQPVLHVRTPTGTLRWIDGWIERWVEERSREPVATIEALERGASTDELPGLGEAGRRLLRRGAEIAPEAQIDLQAAFQRGIDGAVSKTVHLDADAATPDRVLSLLERAHGSGCKGVAFFPRHRRDGVPEIDLTREVPICVECEPG